MVILYFVTIIIIIIINNIILVKTFNYDYIIADDCNNLGTRNINNS